MKKTATKPAKLPTVETARRELMAREARAFAWMLVRLVCVAFLITMIVRNAPEVRPFRVILDAIGGVLILAPLFTYLGRTFAWRIALGKAYVDARQFENADTVLAILSGPRAKLFDARGEGRYYRAVALRAMNRFSEADTILREVEEQGHEPWRKQAKTELVTARAGSTAGGTESASTL